MCGAGVSNCTLCSRGFLLTRIFGTRLAQPAAVEQFSSQSCLGWRGGEMGSAEVRAGACFCRFSRFHVLPCICDALSCQSGLWHSILLTAQPWKFSTWGENSSQVNSEQWIVFLSCFSRTQWKWYSYLQVTTDQCSGWKLLEHSVTEGHSRNEDIYLGPLCGADLAMGSNSVPVSAVHQKENWVLAPFLTLSFLSRPLFFFFFLPVKPNFCS